MKLLLDTCTFLWVAAGSERVSERARELIRNPEHQVFLSVVSVWEIAVKHALGRLPLPDAPERFVPEMREAHGIDALGLDEPSTLMLSRLPSLHRDPFDRMLACQALAKGLLVVTPDEALGRYPLRILW